MVPVCVRSTDGTARRARQALIFGVANDHSIAWGIAQAFHEQGATVGFSSVERLIERRVRPLADSIGATFVEPCDVQDDAQIARVFERGARSTASSTSSSTRWPSPGARISTGAFVDTSRDGFAIALDVSAYSLVALTRAALPLLTAGRSILTLSYYGAEKVVANYNVMGVAKAALEASVRYLAADLGPRGIRVNAISAGPVRTLAASGIAGFKRMYGAFAGRGARCARTSPSRTSAVPPCTSPRPVERGDGRGHLRRWRVQHHGRADRRLTSAGPIATSPRCRARP